MKRSKANKKQKIDIGHAILRFFFGFLIPFVLINGLILFLFIQLPTIEVEHDDSKIKFTVSCLLPITDVKAYFDQTEIPYTKVSDTYLIDANENGIYRIQVKAINGATKDQPITVESRDSEPPIINTDEAIIAGNTLTFNVQDTLSGINYDNLYITTDGETHVKPIYVDKPSGTVQFKIESNSSITIHVEDTLGNYAEKILNIN